MKKFLLPLLILCSTVSAAAETVTIYPDATGTSTYLPLNIYYCSNNIHTQMIYPASELEQLKGKVIEKISFKITRAGGQWTSPSVSVKMGTTTQESYSSTTYISTGLTEVANLTNIQMPVPSSFPSTWEITLDTPFTYTGDNLLLDFANVKGNGPRNWTFSGTTQVSNAGISMTGSPRIENFLPTMTVEYSEASSVSATLSASSTNFRDIVFTGDKVSDFVRLTNTGAEPLNGSLKVEGEGFSVEPTSFEGLAAGAMADFIITFEPAAAGEITGSLIFDIDGMKPMTVALSGTAVSGPTAIRTVLKDSYYSLMVPAGWNAYAEEFYTATNEFSAGSTEYDDFGSSLRFESATVSGLDALLWNHANPMPFSDLYTRAYYLVSPMVGGEVKFGATLNDVPATGAYVKAFSATHDADRNIFIIGDELNLTWDKPLEQGSWSNASTTAPASTHVAFLLKYAALDYFAADTDFSGIGTVTAEPAGENAPAEYFNLQGMKVANPQNGLYIVRRGNTTSKIYIR